MCVALHRDDCEGAGTPSVITTTVCHPGDEPPHLSLSGEAAGYSHLVF